jgi:hypothetical protein
MILWGFFGIILQFFWSPAQSLASMYLLQFMYRVCLSISKIIGRISPYRKIIGVFQNIDNRCQYLVQLKISEKIINIFCAISQNLSQKNILHNKAVRYYSEELSIIFSNISSWTDYQPYYRHFGTHRLSSDMPIILQ